MDSEPNGDLVLPPAVDLHQRIRAITTGVILLSRFGTLGMVALIEAGNDSATQGLRVEYHFANLPDTLPAEVLHAFRHATGEALANGARHAGSSRVRLTALTDRRPTPTVTVAVGP